MENIKNKSKTSKSIKNKVTENKSIKNKSIKNKSIKNKSIKNKSIKNKVTENKSIKNKSKTSKSIKNKSKTSESKKQKVNKKYIFQIGFNRCATQALTSAFEKLNVKAAHHSIKLSSQCPRYHLSILMYNNFNSVNKQIIKYELEKYTAFLDMEYVFENYNLNFYTFFKELETQNIGSSFIMNIRSCISWLLSRIKLGKTNLESYFHNINDQKLKDWIDHYFTHSINVRDYFIRNPTIKARSKLYLLPLEHKTIPQLLKEMNITNKNIPNEKVDFIKNLSLTNQEKELPKSIVDYVHSMIEKHGDPSHPDWWV
jgi:hypothetical protein